MSDTVIKVENLTKKYIIGHKTQERYSTLRDSLTAQAKAWGRRLAHPFKSSERGMITGGEKEEFCALTDVSFEIKRGDRVGIIGRNGAGKSTLLKILSRITEPTSGRIEIAGRVASLLEVGTGFHPELTGRENIFLNGAILGMSKVDIKRKFDEIVAFAEVEKFLDTPVKRYSSGMYVRLAFAVAAHLEPEILIVDEVLAVGDAQFQKKCLGKMEEVGQEGRTVLFVSHNMAVVKSLCTRAIVMQKGSVITDSDCETGISTHISSEDVSVGELKYNGKVSKKAKIRRMAIKNKLGLTTSDIDMADPFVIEIDYVIASKVYGAHVACYVSDQNGSTIIATTDADHNKDLLLLRTPGNYRARFTVPGSLLNHGRYSIASAIGVHNIELYDRTESLTLMLVETTLTSTVAVKASIHPLLQISPVWDIEKESI